MSRVPPQVSGGPDRPRAEELEQLEELSPDAIVAHQQGAHAPVPRVRVTDEARSVVIAEHPTPGSPSPSGPRSPADPRAPKRSERTEKTVVIRDRRQLDELRREMEKRKPTAPSPAPAPEPAQAKGVMLWVIVGVAAFLGGGLVAFFATREDDSASASAKPSLSAEQARPSPAPAVTTEPPFVSLDSLPIEGGKKKKK